MSMCIYDMYTNTCIYTGKLGKVQKEFNERMGWTRPNHLKPFTCNQSFLVPYPCSPTLDPVHIT